MSCINVHQITLSSDRFHGGGLSIYTTKFQVASTRVSTKRSGQGQRE